MRISFSIEVTRQPSVKKLVKQLDSMAEEFIKDMEANKVWPVPAIATDGAVEPRPAQLGSEPSGKVVKIPVMDEQQARRRAAGLKAAETRKKNLAKAARAAKRNAVK